MADEWGQQYQFSEKQILVESRNGGKACPDSKQMLIRKSRLCPALDRCTTTPATAPTTTTSTASTITEIVVNDPIPDIVDQSQSLRSNQNINEVNSGLVNTFTWVLATAYISVTVLLS